MSGAGCKMAGKPISLTLSSAGACPEAALPRQCALVPGPVRCGVAAGVGLAVLALWLCFMAPGLAGAAPMKGNVTAGAAGGFARVVFRFPEASEADVRLANGILI